MRALKLGDMLCSIPALRALRKAYPDARISLLALPFMQQLIGRFERYIDELIPFDPQKPVQGRSFDLAVQMQGGGDYLQHLRPKAVVQFPEDETLHEVHRCLAQLRPLGITEEDDSLEFDLWAQDYLALQDLTLPETYVCLRPGPLNLSKTWSVNDFAEVADHFIAKGCDVVFIGAAQESDLVGEIQQCMKGSSVNAAQLDLPLGAIGALLKGSQGLVCHDTDTSHLAVALKVPSIVIFSESNPVRWSPLNQVLHQVLHHPTREAVISEINQRLLA